MLLCLQIAPYKAHSTWKVASTHRKRQSLRKLGRERERERAREREPEYRQHIQTNKQINNHDVEVRSVVEKKSPYLIENVLKSIGDIHS